MDNGKLKQRGDLILLQLFLDEVLNITGKWTTTSRAKTLRTKTTTIRWYSHNESSITIGGTDAEKVRRSLIPRQSPNILKATKTKLQNRILMKGIFWFIKQHCRRVKDRTYRV